MKTKKINIFAFPSQTAILFWLIAVTLVGAVAFGTAGTAPLPIGWLMPILLLLTLWGFLSRPDRDIRNQKLMPIEEQFPFVREAVRNLSIRIGLKAVPDILVTEENRIYTMGSFRRRYIVAGIKKLRSMDDQLSQPETSKRAEVILLHELYHFKNGDYWQLGLLTELFQTVYPFMLWFMLFFGGWILLLGLASQSFVQLSPSTIIERTPAETRAVMEQLLVTALPSEAEMDALRTKVTEINYFSAASFVFNIALPLIFVATLLWFFYLPLIWQMREFYADSGMTQTLGSTKPFWDYFLNRNDDNLSELPLQSKVLMNLSNLALKVSNYVKNYFEKLRKFSPDGRPQALSTPVNVYYTWKQVALYLGGLVLVLEVFLATPLTLPFIGQNPMHFSTLVVVVAVAYFLLPRLALGMSGWLDAMKIILVVNGIRLAWLVLTLSALWGLYFVAPEYLTEILRSAIYSVARYAGNASFDFDLSEFIVKASVANVLQVPIIFILQLLSTLSLTFLFGRIFKWYSYLATSEVFKRTVFVLTMGAAIILLFIFLPISTAILTGDFGVFVQPIMVVQIVVGALTLIGMVYWFYQNDKRYFGKCPRCGREVTQSSQFLDNCSECGEVLYPWLWTDYDDE